MEEKKKVEKGTKKKKIVFIIILALILIAGGVFAYFKFFKKNHNYFDIYSETFKTSDGKKLNFYTSSDDVGKEAEKIYKNRYLTICQNNDKNYNLEYCDKAKNGTIDLYNYYYNIFQMSEDDVQKYAEYCKTADYNNTRNYQSYLHSWATFDDKIIAIYEFDFNTSYGLYAGNDVSKDSHYPFEYYFLLDYKTGEVLKYNEEIYLITRTIYDKKFHQGTELKTTYFAKKDKTSTNYKIYTTDFKYLGDSLSTTRNLMDDDGYVYAMNNGIISKYDEKGNKKGSFDEVKNIVDFTIFNNNCLALIYENKNLYLYDFSDSSKTKLNIDTNYSFRKNITDNFFFYFNDDNVLNDEVVIYGARADNSTITTTLGNFAVYDYANKKFKNAYKSTMYSNDKVSIELEEYDTKTDENGNVTKYYHLYSNGKKVDVTNKSPYNYAILEVGNKNCVYILNTTTKKIIAYYTSKKEVYLSDEGDGWYGIFENSMYKQMDGKLVIVANKDYGEVLRLSNEIVKGVIIHENNLYVAYDKKIVKYSDAGKILDTITYDEMYSEEYSIVGSLYGSKFVKKGNDYYMIDIAEKGFKLIKAEKITIYSGGNKEVYGYKCDDKRYILVDKEFIELAEKPEKEDDNYMIYSYAGGMCGSNVLIDKKTGDMVATNDMISFIKTSKGYFFSKSECVTDWGTTDIYTSSWKKIGTSLTGDGLLDDNGNIYVINNGSIELRNINGELLLKSKAYKEIENALIHENTLYVASYENSKVYLIILNDKLEEESKVVITNNRSDDYTEIEYKNGKIRMSFFNDEGNPITYVYDIKTKSVGELKSND